MFSCSNAIMRYLSSKYKTPDHWYPSDPQQRAKVDEALDWFHGNLRCGCFFHCVSIILNKVATISLSCGFECGDCVVLSNPIIAV